MLESELLTHRVFIYNAARDNNLQALKVSEFELRMIACYYYYYYGMHESM